MFQEDCQNGLIEINGGTCHIADKHDWILPVKMVDLSSGLFLVSLEKKRAGLGFHSRTGIGLTSHNENDGDQEIIGE